MTRWEYTEEFVTGVSLVDVLNLAGADGWECCGMIATARPRAIAVPGLPPVEAGVLLLLKRPAAAKGDDGPVCVGPGSGYKP
jgi:hypothetical protein